MARDVDGASTGQKTPIGFLVLALMDSEEKLSQNLALLSQADYLVLSSNRNYGVIPRLPKRYPISSQYYPLLFDGNLGYEVVYAGTRMPSLLGFSLKEDSFGWPGLNPPQDVGDYLDGLPGMSLGRFDESFTVTTIHW